MQRRPLIASDVLARYAGDAAREVAGVSWIADGKLQRGKGVSVSGDDDTLAIELSLELEWGRSSRDVGRAVQRSVYEYLERMASMSPASVDIVVGAVRAPNAPPPGR
jgi:uncharacterized alkaline shock family protein YloU